LKQTLDDVLGTIPARRDENSLAWEQTLAQNILSNRRAEIPLNCMALLHALFAARVGEPAHALEDADAAKANIFAELSYRKPWLQNFFPQGSSGSVTCAPDSLYGSLHGEWVTDFLYLAGLIQKYRIIDHRLVYVIGCDILEHVGDKLNLDKISRDVFLNKNYISSVFKKYTGMAVVDFINEAKVDRARLLLAKTNYRVITISQKLSYSDPEYFSKVFKRKTGLTPLQYRNRAGKM
jgi:AraC-like DNA-binding protein